MQVGVDVTYIHTNFGGCNLSGFEDIANFKNGHIHVVHGHQKIQLLKIGSKKMQLGVDVTCINTNFGGRDLSGFGDIATFKNGQFSLSSMVIKKFNCLESAQKKSC